MNGHKKAVEALKLLDKYCEERTCSNCVFSCLASCPLYKLDGDDYAMLDKNVKTTKVIRENGE